jgi:hypothetical protein
MSLTPIDSKQLPTTPAMLAQLPTGGSNGTLLAQVPSEVNPLEAVGNLFVTAVAILGAAVNAGVQYAPELWKKMTDTLAKLGAWGQGVSSKLQQFTEQQQKAFVAAVTTGPVPATLSELRQRVEEAVRTVTAGSSNEPTQARPAPTSRTTPPVTPPETQTKPAPPPTLKPIESAEDPPKATSTQAERSRAQQANATKARQEMQSYISNPIRSDVDLATNWNGLSYWYSGASIGPRPDLPPGVSLTSILREGQKELLTRRVASLEAAIRGLDRNDPQLQGKIRDIDTQLRQFQSFVAGKGLPRAMQTMVAERVEALRGMLRGVGQMAAGDVGRSEQVAAPSQKGERPAAAPTELEASVLRVVDASKAAADALAQEQSLPATASPEQRKAAHEEAVRRGEALRDLLGRPEIVGLMSRGLVAAAGGAPQPPDDRPLYEMLLNGLASALTQSVVDAAQPLVGGQPVPLLQQVRNALEAGLISMVVPQGAGLTGAALANMTEAGLQSVLRGDTPEQTGMNMALGGALGATVHGLLRLLGGGPGPRLQPEGGVMPADGSAPAPKPNGPESPVAIQGSEPPSRPPAAGDAPGSSPDPSARSDATPPGQTPRGAPVPDRAGSRYGYESVQSPMLQHSGNSFPFKKFDSSELANTFAGRIEAVDPTKSVKEDGLDEFVANSLSNLTRLQQAEIVAFLRYQNLNLDSYVYRAFDMGFLPPQPPLEPGKVIISPTPSPRGLCGVVDIISPTREGKPYDWATQWPAGPGPEPSDPLFYNTEKSTRDMPGLYTSNVPQDYSSNSPNRMVVKIKIRDLLMAGGIPLPDAATLSKIKDVEQQNIFWSFPGGPETQITADVVSTAPP